MDKMIDTIKYLIAKTGKLISDSSIEVLPLKRTTDVIVQIKLLKNTNNK